MNQPLQRHLGKVETLELGQYTTETASGDPAVCCPGCGTISDLDKATYRILKGGFVSPIWSCPASSCSITAFLELVDMDEKVLR